MNALIYYVAILSITIIFVMTVYFISTLKKFKDRINENTVRINEITEYEYGFSRISKLLSENIDKEENPINLIYYYVLSQKTEELIKDFDKDKEKAIAIAKWLVVTWRNISQLPKVYNSHTHGSLAEQAIFHTGECGIRATIFVYMAELAGLEAKLFSIYNFGEVGNGHTAVQIFWDDGWHFIDVTYAGYFEKNNKILSFDEIRQAGEQALDYLVPFDTSLDVYGRENNPLFWSKINNRERMLMVYNKNNLSQSDSAGFVGDATPVTLRFTIPAGTKIGDKNGSNQDVFREGRENKISEQLEFMGFSSVPFFHQISLTDLTPGTHYIYEIKFVDNYNIKDAIFIAETSNCELIDGEKFFTKTGLVYWSIEIRAESTSCILDITHNILQQGQQIAVDCINFYVKNHVAAPP